VGYKPVIAMVLGYKPPRTCQDHMLNDLPSVLVGVTNLPIIVEESYHIATSRLAHLPESTPRLDINEALAIAAYSYDLQFQTMDDGKDNLYYVLKNILRERKPHKMAMMKNYLAYLMSGLSKLPPVQGIVYRGIPHDCLDKVTKFYFLGSPVHWSGFTSTTSSLINAKGFADKGGIIFRISIHNGRRIGDYSGFPVEDEVLMSPNSGFIVTADCHEEPDGYFYVDLLEVKSNAKDIF
jgi:hypothetical protein